MTITANDAGKIYDSLAYFGGNGAVYAGFAPDEDESHLTGSLKYTGNSQGAIDVGTYAITSTGFSSPNYQISYIDGKLVIFHQNEDLIHRNEAINTLSGGTISAYIWGTSSPEARPHPLDEEPQTFLEEKIQD